MWQACRRSRKAPAEDRPQASPVPVRGPENGIDSSAAARASWGEQEGGELGREAQATLLNECAPGSDYVSCKLTRIVGLAARRNCPRVRGCATSNLDGNVLLDRASGTVDARSVS